MFSLSNTVPKMTLLRLSKLMYRHCLEKHVLPFLCLLLEALGQALPGLPGFPFLLGCDSFLPVDAPLALRLFSLLHRAPLDCWFSMSFLNKTV